MASDDDILDLDLETLSIPSHSNREPEYRRRNSYFGSKSGLENDENSLENIFETENSVQVCFSPINSLEFV